MDCREFRKKHFAYLDDTLPGDNMAEAQRHLMACDSCAAHDTMVRRSLMLVRNMAVLEPSAHFRQRMQQRIDEARAESKRTQFRLAESESQPDSHGLARQPIVITAVAASVLIMGTIVWRQVTPQPESVTTAQAAPTVRSVAKPTIDTTLTPIYLTPEMVQAMATGSPMWPAALLVDDAPAQLVNSELTQVKAVRE